MRDALEQARVHVVASEEDLDDDEEPSKRDGGEAVDERAVEGGRHDERSRETANDDVLEEAVFWRRGHEVVELGRAVGDRELVPDHLVINVIRGFEFAKVEPGGLLQELRRAGPGGTGSVPAEGKG